MTKEIDPLRMQSCRIINYAGYFPYYVKKSFSFILGFLTEDVAHVVNFLLIPIRKYRNSFFSIAEIWDETFNTKCKCMAK